MTRSYTIFAVTSPAILGPTSGSLHEIAAKDLMKVREP